MTNQAQVIESLMSDYFELESEMTMLKNNQEHIRKQIEQITKDSGGTVNAESGTAMIVAGSKSVSYDTDKITQLVGKLLETCTQAIDDGDKHTYNILQDVYKKIQEARKESVRKESLRISKKK